MAQENNNSIYDDMKQESYRAMLNSEIQASVAKQNALKYTQNQLNQTGYANQGVAQSTNLGIENNYRNALVNAQNQYRQDLMGINEKQQASWAENGANVSNYLQGTYESDENGNITNWDKDAYKRYLENYGVTFNGDEADFSNSRFTETDRDELRMNYQETLRRSGELNENANNQSVVDNSKTFKNNIGDVVNFYEESKTNKNFYLQDENGNTTEWELGSKYTSYPNRLNKAQISMEVGKHNVGDIWLSDDGQHLALVIKDQNGDARMVERTVKGKYKSKKVVDEVIATLNRYSDLGLKIYDKFDYSIVDKNGNIYDYLSSDDGSFVLNKRIKKQK